MTARAVDLGPIQTYYYLVLISGTFIALTFVLMGVAVSQLRRLFAQGEDPVIGWVIAGAVTLVFLVFGLGSVGVIVGLLINARSSS